MLRRPATAVGGLLVLGAAAPLVARAVEPHLGTPVPQLAAFAPLALPVWLLATLLLLGRGRVRVVVTLLMLAAVGVQLWWAQPTALDRAAARPAPGGLPVVVMTQNAEIGAADAGAIVRAAAAQKVDLLVITELTPGLVDRLEAAGLARQLPFSNPHPGPGAAGTGLWSRWPVRASGRVSGLEFAAPRTQVELPDGRTFVVTATHPRALRRGYVDQWRRELAAVGTDARSTLGPRIYAGDYNGGSANSGFRALMAAGFSDAADARRSYGLPAWGFTWPADKPYPPLTRIDHILVTPSAFAVRSTRLVSVPGTDHRGLVASLILRPAGT